LCPAHLGALVAGPSSCNVGSHNKEELLFLQQSLFVDYIYIFVSQIFKFLNPYTSFLTSDRKVIRSSLFFDIERNMLQFQYLSGLRKIKEENINLSVQPQDATHDFSFLVIQMRKCPVHHLGVLKGSLNLLAPEFSAHCTLHRTRI